MGRASMAIFQWRDVLKDALCIFGGVESRFEIKLWSVNATWNSFGLLFLNNFV